ncbi:unnamed protein product [Symbiodinium necroappetens]|uniref:C2H2-type domain-containing protein n=1 Tax=Symbiodinium necroappetens TaxID=1628268 RepID=A0A812SNA7_9DINO|nr:unnamed protein product [Symbiodinium necroappetens]
MASVAGGSWGDGLEELDGAIRHYKVASTAGATGLSGGGLSAILAYDGFVLNDVPSRFSRGIFVDELMFGANATIDSFDSILCMYRYDMWLGVRVGEAQNPGPRAAGLLQGLEEILGRCEIGAEGEDGDWLYYELSELVNRRPKNLLQKLKSLVKQATRTTAPKAQARQARDVGWKDWTCADFARGAQPRHDSRQWSHDAGLAWRNDWDAWCDSHSQGDDGVADWHGGWQGAYSSWDAEAIAGAKAGHAVSYYGAAATPGASWSSTWDDWGGSFPRRRWADLYDEDKGDADEDWWTPSSRQKWADMLDDGPEGPIAAGQQPDVDHYTGPSRRVEIAPSAGGRKRARAQQIDREDAGAEGANREGLWVLRKDVWHASCPIVFAETASAVSEILDSAAGVAIVAWTDNSDIADEIWELVASEGRDADGADVSLTLLCEHTSSIAQWTPGDNTPPEVIPVPGNAGGKLRHKKYLMVTSGVSPARLSTRQAGTHAVRKPPPSLTAQRAASVVVRFTADCVYGATPWADLKRQPAQRARSWASQHGVRQADILDAYGFGVRGDNRLTGLMRIRTEASARRLWSASGALAAGLVFFVDVIGEDHRTLTANWAKDDEVVVQWHDWEVQESFEEYRARVLKRATFGLVLGRRLGCRLGSKDPNFKAQPSLWRARAIPKNYGIADVAALLEDLGFSQVEVQTLHRGRKTNDWTFRGMRGDRQTMLQQHVAWGGGLESDLVVVRESARRGPTGQDSQFKPITERRTVTFGDVLQQRPASRKPKKDNSRPVASVPSASPPRGNRPQHDVVAKPDEQASKGIKRAGPEDIAKMNVDAEANDAHWAPVATLLENPGGGSCLFWAMAQAGFENKAPSEVTHRQMRRFAVQCLQSLDSDLCELWSRGGCFNSLGRPSDLTWPQYILEISTAANWGGSLEVSAVCKITNFRAWIFERIEGRLSLLNAAGEAGFVLLQYDSEKQHWQAFREVDEETLWARHRASGKAMLDVVASPMRGGMGKPSLSACASTSSAGCNRIGARRRLRLSDCASSARSGDAPQLAGDGGHAFVGGAKLGSGRFLALSECASSLGGDAFEEVEEVTRRPALDHREADRTATCVWPSGWTAAQRGAYSVLCSSLFDAEILQREDFIRKAVTEAFDGMKFSSTAVKEVLEYVSDEVTLLHGHAGADPWTDAQHQAIRAALGAQRQTTGDCRRPSLSECASSAEEAVGYGAAPHVVLPRAGERRISLSDCASLPGASLSGKRKAVAISQCQGKARNTDDAALPEDTNPWFQWRHGRRDAAPQVAPWLSQLVTFGPHVASFIARPGFVLCWPCPCGRRITASDSGRLASARRNHITRAHEGEDRANFPVIQHRVNTELTALPPGAPAAWRCSKCMRGIPTGSGSYTHTALAHLRSCPGAPKTLKANNAKLRKAAKVQGLPALSGTADGSAKGLFVAEAVWQQRVQGDPSRHRLVQLRVPRLAPNADGKLRFIGWGCSRCAATWCTGSKANLSSRCRGVAQKRRRLKTQGASWRARNLKRLARTWGILRRFYDNHIGRFAKLLHISQAEAIEMDEVAKKKRYFKNRTVALQKTVWFHDLTTEGIEPNPGPSASSSCGRTPSQLGLFFHNCDGLEGAYRSLKFVAKQSSKPHVIGLAEVRALPQQKPALLQHLRRLGYRGWYFAGDTLTDVRGRKYIHGGILVAMREDVKGNVIDSFIHAEGEAALSCIGSAQIAIVWRRPHAQADGFLDNFTPWIADSCATATPFIAVGDWNWEPDENVFIATGLQQCNVMEGDQPVPSRWQSQRCIDYAIVNDPTLRLQASYDDAKLSDHKAVWIRGADILPTCTQNLQSLVRTPAFLKPASVSTSAWRKLLEKHYDSAPIPVGSTESEWCALCAKASDAYCSALDSLGYRVPTFGTRPKGSLPQTHGHKPANRPSDERNLSLRAHLGRLLEVQRGQARGKDTAVLEYKMERCRPPGVPPGHSEETREIVETAICQTETRERRNRIARWRDKLLRGGSALSAWLHGRQLVLPSLVTWEENGRQHQSSNIASALEAVAGFWQQVWKRDVSQACTRASELAAVPPARPPASWALSAEDLQRAARRKSAGAAGLDGWTALELANLPLTHWRDFHVLLHRWLQRGSFPESWRRARTVFLPKTLPDDQGGVEVAKMRPITILAAHYRIATSCLTRQQDVRDWIAAQVPEYVHGGLQQRAATDALASIDAGWTSAPRACLVTLDMKQAFDRMVPALAVANLRHQGFDPAWASLLSWVWEGQLRYLQLGGVVSPCPFSVSTSTPQGCPVAPIALVSLLAPPARLVQEQISDSGRQSIFLDDRTAVLHSPSHVSTFVNAWSMQCNLNGLQENMDKLRVLCKLGSDASLLLNAGFENKCLVSGLKVLGTTFGVLPDEKLECAAKALDQLRLLPGPQSYRDGFFRTRIVPLLPWGRWWQQVPAALGETWTTKIKQALRVQHVSSRGLWKALAGHWTDANMVIWHSSIRAWSAAARYWDSHGAFQFLSRGRWAQKVQQDLIDRGFTRSPHGLEHPTGVIFPLDRPASRVEVDSILHCGRERWRQKNLQDFFATNRREAVEISHAGVAYHQQQLRRARHLYDKASVEERGVMLGASWSLCAYDKIRKNLPKQRPSTLDRCPFCSAQVPPGWHHLAWQCEYFESRRTSMPHDAWSARLGWPQPGEPLACAKGRLQFLASVRAACRQARGFLPDE